MWLRSTRFTQVASRCAIKRTAASPCVSHSSNTVKGCMYTVSSSGCGGTPVRTVSTESVAAETAPSSSTAAVSTPSSLPSDQPTPSGTKKRGPENKDQVEEGENSNGASHIYLNPHKTFRQLIPEAPHLYMRLEKMGIFHPSRIQEDTLTKARADYNGFRADIVVEDATGSGKTLAYVIPLVLSIKPTLRETQAIVVVPTRELSVQVANVLQQLVKGGSKKKKKSSPIKIRRCVGQVKEDMVASIMTERPHIIVGTPSVISSLLVSKGSIAINKGALSTVVLDEVDHLFHDYSINDCSRILDAVKGRSKACQVMLVSATITDKVKSESALFLSNPRSANGKDVPMPKTPLVVPLGSHIPPHIQHFVMRSPYYKSAVQYVSI